MFQQNAVYPTGPAGGQLRPATAEANPWLPHDSFTEVEPTAGGELARGLTILLRNRRCPWRCVYCDLWKEALSDTVPAGAIPAQIDAVLGLHHVAPGELRWLKLYNAGSFFDRAAIPPADLPAIADRAKKFERVVVESHPSLVGDTALRFRDLLEASRLEVAMGLEIADDAILRKLNKRMTVAQFARAADFLVVRKIDVRAFVIVKPPFVRTEEEAIRQAVASASYAFDCGAGVVSFIAARFGNEPMDELARAGEFAPPRLSTVERVIEQALALRRGRVFVDLWSLGVVSSGEENFIERRARLEAKNLHQCAAGAFAPP